SWRGWTGEGACPTSVRPAETDSRPYGCGAAAKPEATLTSVPRPRKRNSVMAMRAVRLADQVRLDDAAKRVGRRRERASAEGLAFLHHRGERLRVAGDEDQRVAASG